MTTAATTNTTNSPRVLTPTADYFPHDGAALVWLSPHRSLKNAALIYESIKNMPNTTLVRGDFDRKTRPFIFFPERSKKQIALRGGIDTIASKNIKANRKEIHSFLSAIAADGFNFEKPHIQVRKASLELLNNCSQTLRSQKDFKVGDIKESLKILAKAYYADQLEKKTSPHRLLGKQISKIQNKRLREFIAIPGNTALDICAALRKDYVGKYDTRPEMAFFSIKLIVKNFLNQENTSSKSLASFLRQHAFDADIQFFATRWIAITLPKMTDERIQFSTEPWAKELDRICEIIVKSNRRSTRVMTVEEVDGSVTPAKLVLPQSTAAKLPLVSSKVVYSSLNSEDTDDSSSFPSPPNSPYKPKQSSSLSSASVTAAPLASYQVAEQAKDYLAPVSPSQQDDSFTAYSAQSTLSPTNEPKNPMSLGTKFKSQLSALSRNVLPSLESGASLQQDERESLLSNVPEESDQVTQASHTEEKM